MCVVWCFLCGFHIVSCRHINKTEWTTTVCKLLQYDYICVITALCNSGPGRHNRLLSPLRFQACCKLKRGVCAFYCCNILHYSSLSHKELLSFYSVTTTTMKIPAVALHFGVGATLSIGIAFALSSVYEVMMVIVWGDCVVLLCCEPWWGHMYIKYCMRVVMVSALNNTPRWHWNIPLFFIIACGTHAGARRRTNSCTCRRQP